MNVNIANPWFAGIWWYRSKSVTLDPFAPMQNCSTSVCSVDEARKRLRSKFILLEKAPHSASKPLLLSSPFSTPLFLCSSFSCSAQSLPTHTHAYSAWFIFLALASVPRDLYVYGHYWRWVIHFCFSLLLHLPRSLAEPVGAVRNINYLPPLFNHSTTLRVVKIQVLRFFAHVMIWSQSKTLLMSEGFLPFTIRNSLLMNIFFQPRQLLELLIWSANARVKEYLHLCRYASCRKRCQFGANLTCFFHIVGPCLQSTSWLNCAAVVVDLVERSER